MSYQLSNGDTTPYCLLLATFCCPLPPRETQAYIKSIADRSREGSYLWSSRILPMNIHGDRCKSNVGIVSGDRVGLTVNKENIGGVLWSWGHLRDNQAVDDQEKGLCDGAIEGNTEQSLWPSFWFGVTQEKFQAEIKPEKKDLRERPTNVINNRNGHFSPH